MLVSEVACLHPHLREDVAHRSAVLLPPALVGLAESGGPLPGSGRLREPPLVLFIGARQRKGGALPLFDRVCQQVEGARKLPPGRRVQALEVIFEKLERLFGLTDLVDDLLGLHDQLDLVQDLRHLARPAREDSGSRIASRGK